LPYATESFRIRRRHDSLDRRGDAADEVIHRKVDHGLLRLLLDGGERAQVDDDGSQIFVAHRAVVTVGHHRKEHAPVVADALAHRAHQLAVGDVAQGGRRDVRRLHLAGKTERAIEDEAARAFAVHDRHARALRIVLGVAVEALHQVLGEIFAARETSGRGFDLFVRGRSHLGLRESEPAEPSASAGGGEPDETDRDLHDRAAHHFRASARTSTVASDSIFTPCVLCAVFARTISTRRFAAVSSSRTMYE